MFTITLAHTLNHPYQIVVDSFDLRLLTFLMGKWPKVKVVQYDGQSTGDRFHFEINIGSKSIPWKGFISHHKRTLKHWVFIDEGELLPANLKKWQHVHAIIRQNDHQVKVIDKVTFSTGRLWSDLLFYIPIFCMLFVRKWGYKKYYRLQTQVNQ